MTPPLSDPNNSRVPEQLHRALGDAAKNDGWDRQGLAATWILAAPLLRSRVARWIDFERHEIDFSRMLDNGWSHSERLMVFAANDLFNGDQTVGLDELVSTLDDNNLQLVLDAIKIRRGWQL